MDAYSPRDSSFSSISETSSAFNNETHNADCRGDWQEERETLLAELEGARRAVAESVRQRDEMLSAVAHDLRGPLNSIFGWVQLLQGGRLDIAQQTRALEAIVRGTQAQTTLIDSLLDISRALCGRLQISCTQLDASEPLQGAIDAIIERAAAKGVAIHTAIESGLRVNADTARLRQLFSSILDNAVRCTPQGGTISVTLTAEQDTAAICIADSGIGISPDVLPRVFEPFQRPQTGGRSAGRGLGVGLALAREIAKLHRGTIEAFSEGQERGAKFNVRLPLVASSADDAPSASRAVERRTTDVASRKSSTLPHRVDRAAAARHHHRV